MRKALTLIEVMVAATIFVVLALSLYSLLKSASGIRNRLEADDSFTCGSYLNLEVMRRELNNMVAFRHEDSGFNAGHQAISFYTVSFDYGAQAGYVCQVSYAFKDGVLQKTVTHPFTSDTKTFAFMENLSDLRFFYFNAATLTWQELWNDTKTLPRGIRIEADCQKSGGQIITLTKYIWRETGN